MSPIIFVQGCTNNKSQDSFITEISDIIKSNSLFKDSINWQKISEEEKEIPFTENDSINKSLILNFFISSLRNAGDMHSNFLTKQVVSSIRNKTEDLRPFAKYLGDSIGLVYVPYYFGLDTKEDEGFANQIRHEIKKIDTAYHIKSWIIDLRQNLGGNMWPMLAGLNALIADDTVGYFILPNVKPQPWISQNGHISLSATKIDDYKIKNFKVKIAILIDSLTASSGEMAAISFMGLPNVRVFGQPSAGLTTSNQQFTLSDSTLFFIAVSCVADRTKKLYHGKIVPDFIVNFKNSNHDQILDSAKNWLLGVDGG